MTNSTKICPNKDCRKELQPEDQYCASCGTRVPESPAFNRKYFPAIGLGFFIIGIVAGAYISMNLLPDSNASEPMNLSNESEAYRLKTWGDQNKTIENYDTALDRYADSIERDPNLKEVWLAMGDVEYSRKSPNYFNALNYYENATNIDPNYYEAWMGMGNAALDLAENYHESKYYNDSIKYYDRAIEVSKIKNVYTEKSAAMRGLAKNYGFNLSDELRDKAMECSNLATILNPDDPESWTIKGDILLFIGRKEEANECHKKSINLNEEERLK